MKIEFNKSKSIKRVGELLYGDVFTHGEHDTVFMRVMSENGKNVLNMKLFRLTQLSTSLTVMHYPDTKLIMGRPKQ